MADLLSRRKLSVAIVIAILVFAALLTFSDPTKVLSAISGVNPLWILVLFLLVTAATIVRTYRWKLLLASASINIPTRSLLVPFAISQAASLVTPGKVGDPLRCFLIKGQKVRKTIGSVIVERLIDFSLLILLAFSLLFGTGTKALLPVLAAAVLVAGIILAFASRRFARAFWKQLSKIGFVKRYEAHAKEFYYTVRGMVGRGELAAAALVTSVIWVLDFFRLSLIFSLLGYPFSLIYIGQVYSAAIIVGTLSMIPGGMGGQEIVMATLISAAGVPIHIISAAIILERLATYWYQTLLGVLLIPYR